VHGYVVLEQKKTNTVGVVRLKGQLPDMYNTPRHMIQASYQRLQTYRTYSNTHIMLAVVASALGIPALLPFLKAVCQSKKSWQARHTGVKIIQQIAILMGCAVLPHLKQMVEIMKDGLTDEQQKVRTITALALAALAEAATPYGIEAFDSVLKPLWIGTRAHHGKVLAAFLKAVGFIIPLMEPEHSGFYTKEIMPILIREFQTPDEEMKKIVMKVVKQCVGTEGVDAEYCRNEILPGTVAVKFLTNVWHVHVKLYKTYRLVLNASMQFILFSMRLLRKN
jgi:hypothetical protein